MVIESRFSLKQEIGKLIRELGLFEEVIEARSVNDAQAVVDLRAVDCCILGLGLNETAGIEFALRAREEALSKYCSYIKMFSAGSELKRPDAFEAVLEMPTSKAKLAECLIRAVLKGAHRSSWHDAMANSHLAEEDFFTALRSDESLKEAPLPSSPVPTAEPLEQLSRSGTRRIPFGPPLAKIIADLSDHQIAKLGEQEVEEMADLISKKIGIELPRSPSGADPAEGMKQFIKDWLIDRKTLTGYQAFRKLARKLDKKKELLPRSKAQ